MRRKSIFISYRVNDGGHAGRLKHQLLQHFPDDVYRDREDIRYGEPWPAALERALDVCRLLIVLVTPSWVDQVPRLSDPGDWVRKEIQTASARGVPVFVVYAGVRRPLAAADLDHSGLTNILDRQSTTLQDEFDLYEAGFGRLVASIERELDDRPWQYWSIAASLTGLSVIGATWAPQAFSLSTFWKSLCLILLPAPLVTILLWRRRWSARTKAIVPPLAIGLTIALIVSASVVAFTPVVVLSGDLDQRIVAVSRLERQPDQRLGEAIRFSPAFDRSGGSHVARLWFDQRPPDMLYLELTDLPAQCVDVSYGWPFPVADLRVTQSSIDWKSVFVVPDYELFYEIGQLKRPMRLKIEGVSAELLDKPYTGDVVWIGASQVASVSGWLPSPLPGLEGAQNSASPLVASYQRRLRGKPAFWNSGLRCGVPGGGTLKWTLTAMSPEQLLSTGETVISARPQSIIMRSHP